MEAGALGDAVAYLVEEEAGQELVQTLPLPMEEMTVGETLVGGVTHRTVGAIQVFSFSATIHRVGCQGPFREELTR